MTTEDQPGSEVQPRYLRSLGGLEQSARALEDMLNDDSSSQISILDMIHRPILKN